MSGAEIDARADEGVGGANATELTEPTESTEPTEPTELSAGGDATDPRLYDEATRVVSGATGDAVVVGVVHDHPASVYRAGRVVEAAGPDVVAVELPPLALELFESLPPAAADPDATGDSTGDDANRPNEMSAALAAADGARTVGIDGIDPGFLRGLAGLLRREGATLDTVGDVARSVVGVGQQTLACSVAARRGDTPDHDRIPRGGADYEVTAADPPVVQAEDERRHRSRSRSLLRAIERPHADRLLDAAREDAMARRLARRLEEGTVVAVVGFEHLDPVADGLRAVQSENR